MTMAVMKRAWLWPAILVAGCASPTHKPTPTPTPTLAAKATITGTLQAVGGPGGTPNRPLRGAITAAGSGRSYSVSVGTDGHFSVTVPAGIYTIVGRSPLYQGGAAECQGRSRQEPRQAP